MRNRFNNRIVRSYLLAATCGAATAQAQDTIRIRDLQRDLRIDHDDRYKGLMYVSDMEVSPAGVLYIAQPEASVVRVFDPKGKAVAVVGGPEYPPRLRFPIRIGWKADSLWVWDMPPMQIHVYDAQLRLRRSINLGTIGSMRLLHDGTVAVKRYDEDATPRRDGSLSAPLLRYDYNGKILDTIADLDASSTGQLRISMGFDAIQTKQPFADDPLWAAMPSGTGFVVVDRAASAMEGPATYRVTRLDNHGDTVFTRSIAFQARAVSRSLVDSIAQSWVNRLATMKDRQGGPTRVDRDEISRSIVKTKTVPPVTALAVGLDETIWLRGIEEPSRPTVLWTVLDKGGATIARVSAPKTLTIYRTNKDVVWGSERLNDVANTVVRYVLRDAKVRERRATTVRP